LETDSSNVERVTLIQTGAATHSTNFQHRFVELVFSNGSGALSVEMPRRAADTPPGYYLLFLINDSAGSSKAKLVRVMLTPSPPPPPPSPLPASTGGGGGATGLELLVLLGLPSVYAQPKRNMAGR
jgi:hypothetical protein